MKIFRNPEVKKETIINAIIAVLAAGGSFFIGTAAGIAVLVTGAVLIVVHVIYSNKRYEKIAGLAESVDRILHGQADVMIDDSDEGELSILKNEIHKMLLALNEKSDLLQAEKKNLSAAIEDIFHQMRTPLTSMLLDAELLGTGEMDFDKRRTLAREIKKQLERMRWLVESLLKMSKISSGTALFVPDKVSVREVLKKAETPFLIQMELKGVDYICSVHDENFTVDSDWTCEALANLIKNCMEHTPAGGRISVEVTENALYTEIIVSDTGEGFNEKDIPYLFERFYKGQNASPESIGIGLALSRSIITAQNGTITAKNAPEGGAQFIVKFYKTMTV